MDKLADKLTEIFNFVGNQGIINIAILGDIVGDETINELILRLCKSSQLRRMYLCPSCKWSKAEVFHGSLQDKYRAEIVLMLHNWESLIDRGVVNVAVVDSGESAEKAARLQNGHRLLVLQ